jgi:hypothetical protein
LRSSGSEINFGEVYDIDDLRMASDHARTTHFTYPISPEM